MERARDLLPLPAGAHCRGLLKGFASHCSSSSAAGRRLRRCRANDRWLLDGIGALNELGGEGRSVQPDARLSGPQQSAIRRLAAAYGRVPADVDKIDDPGAWKVIQGVKAGYGAHDLSAGARACYQRGMLSLPSRQAGAVPLLGVAPPALQSLLVSGTGLLRSQDQVAELLAADGTNVAMDEKLACLGHEYGHFLLELFDKGIIEQAVAEHIKERTGAFCVKRKDSKLRLIFDTRRANFHFLEPPHTDLAGGEALSEIDAPLGKRVQMAQGDVEVCFYQYELPVHLRGFFALPSIRAKFLPWVLRRRLGAFDDEELIDFWSRVVPMGWSWAVHIVQLIHLDIFKKHVGGINVWMADKKEAVTLTDDKFVAILYIDNFAVLGLDRAGCQRLAAELKAALSKYGIISELETDPAKENTFLGFELNAAANTWVPAPRKFWRIAGALRHVCSAEHACTGQELERLVGHVVALCCIRRELLSILGSAYKFIADSYERRQPLWPSVRKELRQALALLPLAQASMQREWHTEVMAYDASEYGYGVVQTTWEKEQLADNGGLRERARFAGPLSEALAPRAAALQADMPDASSAEIAFLGRASRFREVRAADIRDSKWSVLAARKWKHSANIHILEAGSFRWALKHMARTSRWQGRRILFLGDNMAVTCSLSRARARDWMLLSACRLLCAVSLLADVKINPRWIPSELNPADAPSRFRIGHRAFASPAQPSYPQQLASHQQQRSHQQQQAAAAQDLSLNGASHAQATRFGVGQQQAAAADGWHEGRRHRAARAFGANVWPRCLRRQAPAQEKQHAREGFALRRADAGRAPQQTLASSAAAARAHPLGGGQGSPAYAGGVPPGAHQARGLVAGERPPGLQHAGVGRHPGRVPRVALRHGSTLLRGCASCPCSPLGLPNAGWADEGRLPHGHAHTGRLAQTRAAGVKATTALGGGGRRGASDAAGRIHLRGLSHHIDVRNIHETIGADMSHCTTSGAAHCSGGRQRPFFDHSASRVGVVTAQQNQRVRPHGKPGFRSTSLDVRLRNISNATKSSTSKPFRFFVPPPGAALRPDVPRPQRRRPQADLVLSTSRRRHARRAAADTRLAGDSTARAVEGMEQHAQVRETRPHRHAAAEASAGFARESPDQRKHIARALREVLAAAFRRAKRPQRQVVVEVFAGCGNLSKAFHARGEAVVAWDIVFGDHFDLRYRTAFTTLVGWITSGLVKVIWFGTPCEGFSRARRGPPGGRLSKSKAASETGGGRGLRRVREPFQGVPRQRRGGRGVGHRLW